MPTKNNRRLPVWIPYLNVVKTTPSKVTLEYKGGTLNTRWTRVQSIMLYGGHCPLSEDFLEYCRKFKIPICIHKRNVANAIWVTQNSGRNTTDLLTPQIIFRRNKKKQRHITYKLLNAKFKSMEWLVTYPLKFNARLTVDEMRVIESIHAKRYWNEYYKKLGYDQFFRRSGDNPIKSSLDAISKFTTGIMLRWLCYHNLSPYHGFLHIPTDYPALAYDLIEPYRGYIEKAFFNTVLESKAKNKDIDSFVDRGIVSTKDLMNSEVYTNPTRQIVTFQELLHGNVLALRSYLLKTSVRFIPPIPSKPNGGRPVKAGYKLYGRSAGPTDFWQEASSVSVDHEQTMKKYQE